MKICLVGCVKTQEKDENKKYMAEKLYKSRIYNRCLQEAKRQKPDRIYILSTKYGLLHLDEQIFPYNFPALGISYNDHQTKDRKFRKECKQKWISNVYEQIQREGIDLRDEFLFYASGMFYKALKPKLVNCSKKINCRTGKQYNDTKK